MTQPSALVLAGHGSHISPHTAGQVWQYVDQLRARNVAHEVTACFWKEQPSFAEVLGTLTAEQVYVVPVFTAQGFYTQQVIPVEMGLSGAVTHRHGKTIHYTRTLGEHEGMPNVLLKRVQTILATHQLDPLATTVAVIGHGTRRSDPSQRATHAQVEWLQQTGCVAEVLGAFLDAEPSIPSIYERATHPTIIVVPFFLAMGSHVTLDVPSELGLKVGESFTERQGKRVHYTPPVGSDPHMVDFILDLATEAGFVPATDLPTSAWQGFPQAGWQAFGEWWQAHAPVRFGELDLTLQQLGKGQANASALPPISMAELRQQVRENPFRPLSSAINLTDNGYHNFLSLAHGCALIETIYPGAIALWAQQQQGELAISSLNAVIERQVGNFRHIQAEQATASHLQAICSACTRQPLWQGQAVSMHAIPCPEPCNFWLTSAIGAQESDR
ncbi:MAG: CbiX/SirB N-terminal domain-containing protein [Phototrophicaceae bacterium]